VVKFAEFRDSLTKGAPPVGLESALCALWHDAKGNWARAHELVQGDESDHAAWVHAYLHRKEGDLSNAAYWYRRAGKPVCKTPLATEWESLADALL